MSQFAGCTAPEFESMPEYWRHRYEAQLSALYQAGERQAELDAWIERKNKEFSGGR